MQIKLLKYILVLFLFFTSVLQSQENTFVGNDFWVTEKLDTVLLHRVHTPIWYGIMAGGNYNMDLGELKLPRRPLDPPDDNNKLIDYIPVSGSGYFIGVASDWRPINAKYGVGLKAYIIDDWTSTAFSGKYKDELQTEYDDQTNFKYLTIGLSGRYDLGVFNLHAYGGLNVGINLATYYLLFRHHVNNAPIDHDYKKHYYSKLNTRFGGQLGLGYEKIIMDINHRLRLQFSPYVEINAGSAMLSLNGSSWNTVTFRVGLSFKFSPDKAVFDTLKYVPQKEKLPVLLTALDIKSEVSFPGFNLEGAMITGELAAVEKSVAEKEVKIEPIISLSVVAKPDILKAIAEKADIVLAGSSKPKEKIGEEIKRIKLLENVKKTFNYSKSATVDLSKEMRTYLDQVAVYLKENPGTLLGITGHSDNQGTFIQNDARAKKRADNVAKYLMKKGISLRRLLASGKGSIQPIASNKTETGRRKNRRVEIKIVPSPKRNRRKKKK